MVAAGTPERVNVGCGEVKYPGWLNVDIIPTADLVHDVTQGLPWPDGSVRLIYNEHVLEHLTVEQGLAFLRECHRVLTPGGALRIATPDLDYLIAKYVSDWRDQDWLRWPEYQFIKTRPEMLNVAFRWWGHQYLYNELELGRRLAEAGVRWWRRAEFGRSFEPNLCNLETRDDSRLVMEGLKL